MKRYLEPFIESSLPEKIILISGPRQTGKTYLSQKFFPSEHVYLNFDEETHRKIIREKIWTRETPLVILDELHKMKNWKRWLKGIYDTEGIPPCILVTGSARLDTWKKAGDSLAGRFYQYRLHPLSINEVNPKDSQKCLEKMMELGSFPEPFLKDNKIKAAIWRKTHIDVILRQDLLDLENVRELKLIEILVQLLADRVGSSTSYSSLARNLEVSSHTIKRWINILESLFVVFIVTPYSRNIAKAILKEPKIYFYDTGRVTSGPSAKLENIVACHLLKQNHFWEDTMGKYMGLSYIRDKNNREVDFLVTENNLPKQLIEVKTSDDNLHSPLQYFRQHLSLDLAFQIVLNLKLEKEIKGCKIQKADQFLKNLEI